MPCRRRTFCGVSDGDRLHFFEEGGFMLLRVILVLMMILSCGALSQAAPHKMASVKKKNAYILDGVFTGGKSGEGYTILGLRRFF